MKVLHISTKLSKKSIFVVHYRLENKNECFADGANGKKVLYMYMNKIKG